MKKTIVIVALTMFSTVSMADNALKVEMNLVDQNGTVSHIGNIVVSETKYGVVFTPQLTGLPTGIHGIHVHENPSCDAKEKEGKKIPALAAGGHYDPQKTGFHGAPWDNGHLGDLPPIYVDADGKSIQAILAPRLKLLDLKGRSLMIHAGGDNHADHPFILGGGGARIACGVVQ